MISPDDPYARYGRAPLRNRWTQGQNSDVTPSNPGQVAPAPKSFFDSMDRLNQMIETQKQGGNGSGAMAQPYEQSLKRLTKLNRQLDNERLPAINDILFPGFGQVDPSTAEGQELQKQLGKFFDRLKGAGKLGKVRAQQVKLAYNINLLNGQVGGLQSIWGPTPQDPVVAQQLAATLAVRDGFQKRLDKLLAKDPGHGKLLDTRNLDQNGGSLSGDPTSMYNQVREMALKMIQKFS